MKDLIIDCFAGGGGASVGIEIALGRTVDMQCAGMNIKKYRVINGMYVED